MHKPSWTRCGYHGRLFIAGGLLAFLLVVFSDTPNDNAVNRTVSDAVHLKQIRAVANEKNWHALLPLAEDHIETPAPVRGIYLSAWTAGTPNNRKRALKLITDSNFLNTVIIDIKDSTGHISYTGSDPVIRSFGSYTNRIPNIQSVINDFHKKDIYVIGRLTAFEDPLLATTHDELVLSTKNSTPWRSRTGKRQWIDPANVVYHDYLVRIAREAYELGFDEINFDYIRYPSEGDTQSVQLPEGVTRRIVLKQFFQYLDDELRVSSKIPISADVFGLTTTASNDIGIGQVWEDVLKHFDYVSPMIYPSHYAAGSFGFDNPAEYPGPVITRALEGAIQKTQAAGDSINKIRPWIQDFDLGAIYDTDQVREQITSLKILEQPSFLSWDPSNRYTQDAYTFLDSN